MIASLCGIAATQYSRRQLKPYKENFYAKFKNSFFCGFFLTFVNRFYWIGNFVSIIVAVHLINSMNWILLILWAFFWYTLLFILIRMGFDTFIGDSPPRPSIILNNSLFQKGFEALYKELEINLNAPIGKLKHWWAMPSGKYMAAYLWDSAFIALAWKYWDGNVASGILRPLLDNQAEDGRIPHFVSFISSSRKTQPPLLAWSISHLDVDKEYLMEAYKRLKKYNQWLYKNRRLEKGLFFWAHSYESGMDNSPRFTDRSEKVKYDLTTRAEIDLNSFIVLQNNSLIKIASELKKISGNDDFQEDVKEFERKNEELIGLIQNYLWDEQAGLYFDYDFKKNERIQINTIASFFPLIAGIPTKVQAERLIEHLKNEQEYNTLIPLPTVALNEQMFEKDTWRGPMWLNTAYLVIKGLEKYREYQLSSDFAFRIIQGVFKTWKNEGSFYEFYDPERFDLIELSRKKGNLWKQITLGGKPVKHFVGWTGLISTLMIESIIGFDLLGKFIQPRFVQEVKGSSIILNFSHEAWELTITYVDEKDITIHLRDLSGNTPDLIKKCTFYQIVTLAEFFR